MKVLMLVLSCLYGWGWDRDAATTSFKKVMNVCREAHDGRSRRMRHQGPKSQAKTAALRAIIV